MDYKSMKEVPLEIREQMHQVCGIQSSVTGHKVIDAYVEWITFPTQKGPNHITLNTCLIDSSQRHQGVLVQESWSHHQSFEVGGEIIYAIRRLSDEERTKIICIPESGSGSV